MRGGGGGGELAPHGEMSGRTNFEVGWTGAKKLMVVAKTQKDQQ